MKLSLLTAPFNELNLESIGLGRKKMLKKQKTRLVIMTLMCQHLPTTLIYLTLTLRASCVAINYLKEVIKAASMLEVNTVTTFIGKNKNSYL